ncbi:hypothetical protein ACRRTK_019933 [Alexandromys fortis]
MMGPGSCRPVFALFQHAPSLSAVLRERTGNGFALAALLFEHAGTEAMKHTTVVLVHLTNPRPHNKISTQSGSYKKSLLDEDA